MHSTRLRPIALFLALAPSLACDDDSERSPEAGAEPGGKDDSVGGTAAIEVDHPGALQWAHMQPLQTSPTGVPLFVSNNPEHIHGFGVLAGVPHPNLALSGANRHTGAPQAQWNICDPVTGSCQPRGDLPESQRSIDPRCPNGGLSEFGVYIAHILPTSLGNSRHLSLAVHADSDVTLRVRGSLDTTDWSSNGVMLTQRPGWIGARLAEAFFFGDGGEQTFTAAAGELVVIDTQSAKSMIEGRFEIEAEGGCVFPYTVAHADASLTELPSNYAPGDVKWPGWLNGQGLGRAAGVYRGDIMQGEQKVTITRAPSVQGVGLLSQPESLRALAKHGDSADVLFGNYGALYQHGFTIQNDTGACIQVRVDFASYLDRNGTPTRTPTVSFFDATTSAGAIPSMFWNGPLQVTTATQSTLHRPILFYAPTDAERSDTTRAVQSMRQPLTTVPIEAGQSQRVDVQLPVPGYIVAPAAFTFEAKPC